MAKISYQFADGHYEEIEVTEDFKREYEFMLVRERAPYWKAVKQKQRAGIPTSHDWSLSKMVDDGIDYAAKNDPIEVIIRLEELSIRMQKMLALLSDKQKEVYILHHIKGLKKIYIAELLHIDESSVRERLFWAQKKILKNFLKYPRF